MIRKLKGGKCRLYSRKKAEKSGKRRNLGTFDTREATEKRGEVVVLPVMTAIRVERSLQLSSHHHLLYRIGRLTKSSLFFLGRAQ
ncbi:MAG: hypothetical protein EOS12_25455 [Mesorhizobium sp.]|nr:MAG: hypothetical protein EOS12_25455 [Mesorhizobium sp.]